MPYQRPSFYEESCVDFDSNFIDDLRLMSDGIEALASATDKTITYSFSEINGNDGDGIIAWELIGTEQPSGTVVSTQTITLPEESDGVHFSGQPTHDGATGVITFPTVNDADESAGAPVTLTIPPEDNDTVAATGAAGAALINGLSKGNVNKPVNAPATLTDVQNADPRLGVSYQSMQQLFTNRAVEAGAGMMNPDGSLGHYSKIISYDAGETVAALDDNGSHVWISSQNSTFDIPAPRYIGQLVTLQMAVSNPPESQVLIVNAGATVAGITRDSSNAIRRISNSESISSLYMRPGETIQLVALNVSIWAIRFHNYNLLSGPGWRENEDGTVDMWMNVNTNSLIAGSVTTHLLPVVLNGTPDISNTVAVITDLITADQGPPPSVSSLDFTGTLYHAHNYTTNTHLGIGSREGSKGSPYPLVVGCMIKTDLGVLL